ncbi:hypothetical protein ACSV5N_16885 [Agrobacterium salinitolerans]|uniref:hypothetical protein n=1 Tax=Agrobacterium salinitolerans TaxID=1183413 RepID=UPI003FD062C0
MKNYNHTHVSSGSSISGTHAESITVGDMRDAIAEYPDDAEIVFGHVLSAGQLMFYRFKSRGEKTLQMEFNTDND